MSAYLCLPSPFHEDALGFLVSMSAAATKGVKVGELYGGLRPAPFGSGRAPAGLPNVGPDRFKAFVAACTAMNVEFNYTLNGSCYGGAEHTPQFREQIHLFCQWLVECGVTTITVAAPFLVELIARNHPTLRVCVSIIQRVDGPEKARFFKDLGARRIVVFEDVNRNFRQLERIANVGGIELEVVVNSPCVFGCPTREYHYTLQAHANEGTTSPYEDWMARCALRRLKSPAEYVKGRGLVRPEDLGLYESAGVEHFKVVGREAGISNIVTTTAAFLDRSFHGNLLELLPAFEGRKPALVLDNRNLDGFIDFFREERNPCVTGCVGCGYCEKIPLPLSPGLPPDWASRTTALEEGIKKLIGGKAET